MPILLSLTGTSAGANETSPAPWQAAERPNFLLIIAEDMGPWLGAYGYHGVHTPNLDALAARGALYTQAWATGPACSPARSSFFTGMWAPSLGTETHREPRPIPPWTLWTQYLRAAGYYTTNNAKTDYNADAIDPAWWDECSPDAHYQNRSTGQPFFHVYSSLMETHMSFLLDYPLAQRTHRTVAPAAIELPPSLPADPTLQDDRAWHWHGVNLMDGHVGRILAELDRSGEADRTVVVFFADHGGVLPNAKGYANHAGFHIPLIIHIPSAFLPQAPGLPAPGSRQERPVSLMDLPRTLFHLAGVPPPDHLLGHSWVSNERTPASEDTTLFAYRGVNGGRWDVVRAIRQGHLVYTRNYLPFRAAGIRQHYHMRMPGQQSYEQRWREGATDQFQAAFWEPRQPEELHDLSTDQHQLHNLVHEPAYASALIDLRQTLDEYLESIADLGFVPNTLRSPDAYPTFYDRMTANPSLGKAVQAAAREAAASALLNSNELNTAATHEAASVRYWAAVGLVRLAYEGRLEPTDNVLARLMDDPSEEVRIAAAEAAVASGQPDRGLPVLLNAIALNRRASREALSAIETLGQRAAAAAPYLLELLPTRADDYYFRSTLITLGLMDYNMLFPSPDDLAAISPSP